jgi:regulator of RNase E activity RraA
MNVSNSPDDVALREQLLGMTTATATAMLNLRGFQNQFMTGARPIQTGGRVCGRALTVRFGPERPDMAFSQEERHTEPLWRAIESIVPGDFLVLDCGGDVRAGTTGDILADDDGLVAIPAALAAEVATDGVETELKETFIRGLVDQGVPLGECYPPTAEVVRQFHAWKHERNL